MDILFDSELDDRHISFAPPPWVSIVAVVSLSLTALIAITIYLGIWIGSVALISTAAAFVMWLRIGYRYPVTRRALPAHILLIIANLLLAAELNATGFAATVTAAFPDLIQPSNTVTDFSIAMALALCASALWLFGGALAFYHLRVGGFTVLLLAFWSLAFPLSNFALPLLSSETAAIPGLIASPLVAALAALGVRHAWRNRLHGEPA